MLFKVFRNVDRPWSLTLVSSPVEVVLKSQVLIWRNLASCFTLKKNKEHERKENVIDEVELLHLACD